MPLIGLSLLNVMGNFDKLALVRWGENPSSMWERAPMRLVVISHHMYARMRSDLQEVTKSQWQCALCLVLFHTIITDSLEIFLSDILAWANLESGVMAPTRLRSKETWMFLSLFHLHSYCPVLKWRSRVSKEVTGSWWRTFKKMSAERCCVSSEEDFEEPKKKKKIDKIKCYKSASAVQTPACELSA